MVSDARFGIELYDGPDRTQVVDGKPATVVGHVWSPDAERIVTTGDGRVLIVDPSGANPTPLNANLDSTEAFLEAFRVFYLGDRPPVAPKMTVAEARARLAALQRNETLPESAPPAAAPRAERVATLRARLEAQDPDAVVLGTWWSRILQRPEFDTNTPGR
ncbi:hypothetical protein GCM10025867_42990 [Frondihabitans sucicola]|uniref:SUKH-4 immunity protein of toxin-antitoxin system n=1 Tax=Frondihabitans sucicola TaxID=1268041 RepID=A0ABM8GUE7_9MICO|nr:SUKH-4 family immunity protein [Frondihabitans sucicola]BDZ52058.1 hypothetical protein GCM10025867_42990 [Frondihabitans sucicola]